MPIATSTRTSARERLLAAADELFYAEGVHTVGIDRVIERAGVAKATLYSAFGSKDALIEAYLDRRRQTMTERLTRQLAKYETPRDRLLGVFESQAKSFALPGFRGCPFINASAEEPVGGAAQEPSDAFRVALRTILAGLAEEAGAADPERLARQLALLYDGAIIGAWMDRDPAAGAAAREMAAVLIGAAVTGQRRGGARRKDSDARRKGSDPIRKDRGGAA